MNNLIDREYLLSLANADGAYDYVSTKEIAEAPTVPAVPMSVVEGIKEKIKSNMESIIGRYDSSVSLKDMASYKLCRNDVREECLKIINHALEEYTE